MRWLRIQGFSFQPSEFAKLGLVIFLSYFLTKKEEKIRSFSFSFLPTLLLSGLVIVLVLKEPDFGAATFLTAMVFLLLFVSGARVIYIAASFLLAAPVVYYFLTSAAYRYQRLMSFIRPWDDPGEHEFPDHPIVSFLRFGRTLRIGTGGGEAETLLPARAPYRLHLFRDRGGTGTGGRHGHGAPLLHLHLERNRHIANSMEDRFGTFLALGMTLMISLQAVINMGVVLGLLPTKGLTLPFISYGGTSLITNLVGVGILLRLSTQVERK